MKIELYTCENGKELFENGNTFSAWKKDTSSYRGTDVNVRILVDENDITELLGFKGEYNVIDIKSVEIIG